MRLARLAREREQANEAALPSVIEVAEVRRIEQLLAIRIGRARRLEAEIDRLREEILSENEPDVRGTEPEIHPSEGSPSPRPVARAHSRSDDAGAGPYRPVAYLTTSWYLDRARRWGMRCARRRPRRPR